ncbi:MAG TPA: oxidoreductase family protein [Dehalococcoidia bacterium]|nr:oxidoreductase family protein [Dehalococcoidia bacterium]
MTTQLEIPTTPAELTAAWLTAALRSGGVIGDGRVTSAAHEVLGQGAGFIGQVARVRLTYAGAPAAAPATLIAKLPALEPGARELAALYGLYEREFRFYREMADEISFRTARCYYSDGDAEAVRYVLLLEDLSRNGRAGDQVAGCSAAEARLALSQLAVHHARWWEHPRLTEIAWLQPGIDMVNGAMQQSYPQAWAATDALFADRMPQPVRAVLPTLGERITKLLEPIAQGAMTMAHGDYRLDNMFFGAPGSDYQLAVLDWQSPNQGWGAYDIAYFLYSNVDTATRRAHEMEMLQEYHRTLTANGVSGYTFDELVEDYKRSLLVSLGIWVVNAATLDTANERGKALFDLFFDRLSAAIMDLDALALLPV